MNALKTEMDKTSPTVAVVCVGGVNGLQFLGRGGETMLFPMTSWGQTGGGAAAAAAGAESSDGTSKGTRSAEAWEPGELSLDGGTMTLEPVPVITPRQDLSKPSQGAGRTGF